MIFLSCKLRQVFMGLLHCAIDSELAKCWELSGLMIWTEFDIIQQTEAERKPGGGF